jgi:SAM-dependent MidA family methyltransferase
MPAAGAGPGGAREAIRALIRREGPIPFSRFQELALYGPGGFFTSGRGSGRAGRDFVTAPEVGPLFGACVARALDRWWRELGAPDPYVVVEAGAGPGRLAREVLRAEPSCAAALHYLLVERSPALRAAQRELLSLEPADEVLGPYPPGDSLDEDDRQPLPGQGPIFAALDDLPARIEGVVLANELLDNLPVDIAEHDGDAWREVRVGIAGEDLVEVVVPAATAVVERLDALLRPEARRAGIRLPVTVGLDEWIAACGRSLRHGRLVLVDYVAAAEDLAARGRAWLRTYRGHRSGADPLAAPGRHDITADVERHQLLRAAARAGFELVADVTLAQWLAELGIDALVDEGRRIWQERAHLGDLTAIAGRSRAVEAAALTDPAGIGAQRVLELVRR